MNDTTNITTRKRAVFNNKSSDYAFVNWKLEPDKFSVVPMNDIETIENEYEIDQKYYRVIWNGKKLNAKIKFIGL
jgi:hypothetical protein